MRRYPSQQSEFPVRISIFWLLHRETFTRTLETAETRQIRMYELEGNSDTSTVYDPYSRRLKLSNSQILKFVNFQNLAF